MLVSSKAVTDPDYTTSIEKTIAGIHNPILSLDKKKIYFMSAAWANSDSIHVVNIESKSEKYICPGNSLEIIKDGCYRGKLIVNQHRHYSEPKVGSYDNYYIVDEEGKEIKDMGENEDNIKDYL